VRECLRHLIPGGRFILGVSDQVPPDGDLRRVQMVTEIVEKEGRYT
jgi:hypothetical protein